MNKRLVAALVALVLVILIVLLNAIFNRSNSSGDICKDFITNIQQGKAKKTFGMLSEKTQGITTSSKWEEEVTSLKIAYFNGTVTKKSTDTTTIPGNEKPQTREVFTVKSGGSTYQATCFITDSKLDAFDSQPVY
ncbi:MAG TPA: hypothetical protein VLH86_01475 [Patescibacteria group bacterium]|nr:hypothetical protein [Patescibacteria group bacterium]